MTIVIEDSLLQAQAINPQYVKEQIALLLYEKKILTIAQSSAMAGIALWDFQQLMAKNDVPISYDETDLEQDLAVLPHIFPTHQK